MEQPDELSNEIKPAERYLDKKQQRLREEQSRIRRRWAKSLVLWGTVVIGISLLMWGLIWIVKQTPENQAIIDGTVTATDWVTGNRQAKTVLIEYGDFQCPACFYYYSIVKDLLNKNNEKMQFVFRHFPLAQHANARSAARAAEAAGRQGKFWGMYDLIYAGQKTWSNLSTADAAALFAQYASALKLDPNKYKSDLGSEAANKKINDDYNGGVAAGINATPTFYLNGKKIVPNDLSEFQKLIDAAAK